MRPYSSFVSFWMLSLWIIPGSGQSVVPGISKVADVQMTYSGLGDVSYGGYLNGESFQQDGILTFNGYQYTCFWNTERRVILARRLLPSGPWQKIEISDYTNSANDAHNTISLGISPKDGVLHVAFDHHGDDLHYINSVPGLTSNPENVPWARSSFNAVTSYLANSYVTQVTYPRFITTPSGNMLFEYRYGSSGNGNQVLWEYTGDGQWSFIGTYVDGISDSINAYPHGLEYQGSRLHMSWTYRSTPDASTNFNLHYIYSDDDGRSWKDNSGSTVAISGSTPIRLANTSTEVWAIAQNRGLINQEHMTVDHDGNVHVLLSHMPDYQGDDANFTSARLKSQYYHYWRNTRGVWARNELDVAVIKNFRGKLAVSQDNNLYAILPNLRIAAASEASAWTDWSLIDAQDAGRFFSDPLIDISRLKEEDVLTVYAPQADSGNIYTLDYHFNANALVEPGIASGGTYKIIARHSGKALDVYTSSNNLLQYSYWGGSNQQFLLTGLEDGYFMMSPIFNLDLALDVDQQSMEDGANVQAWSYWGGHNQQWHIYDGSEGFYVIENRGSGKVLHIGEASTANSANVMQWSYENGANQQFSFVRLR